MTNRDEARERFLHGDWASEPPPMYTPEQQAENEARRRAYEGLTFARPTLPRRLLNAVSAAWRWVRELP